MDKILKGMYNFRGRNGEAIFVIDMSVCVRTMISLANLFNAYLVSGYLISKGSSLSYHVGQ